MSVCVCVYFSSSTSTQVAKLTKLKELLSNLLSYYLVYPVEVRTYRAYRIVLQRLVHEHWFRFAGTYCIYQHGHCVLDVSKEETISSWRKKNLQKVNEHIQ